MRSLDNPSLQTLVPLQDVVVTPVHRLHPDQPGEDPPPEGLGRNTSRTSSGLTIGFVTRDQSRLTTREASEQLLGLSHSIYRFDQTASVLIFSCIMPVICGGGWAVLGLTDATAWDSFWLLPVSFALYFGAVAVYVRRKLEHHEVHAHVFSSWPSSYTGTGYGPRFWLHNGFTSFMLVYATLAISLMFNVWLLEGNALCSPYTQLRFLDTEKTSIQLWSCDWELWTRNLTKDVLNDYTSLGYDDAWTLLYPELVELNTLHNTTFKWVPSTDESRPTVMDYVHQYYVFLQGQNACCVFVLLSLVLAANSWDLSDEVDDLLERERNALDAEYPEAFSKWTQMEEVATMASQATVHDSFTKGSLAGASAFLPALWVCSWASPLPVSFVISILLSSAAFGGGIFMLHTLIFAKAMTVLTRLNARIVLLGKMVGGTGVNLGKVGIHAGDMHVNEWYALRDFVLRTATTAEFGLVAATIMGQLMASAGTTLFFVFKVIALDHLSDMVMGTMAFGGFAILMWMYTLPLLGSAVATNTELLRHRLYLMNKICKNHNSQTTSVEGNAEVQNIQFVIECLEKYPALMKISGVPLTAETFMYLKGYIATAISTVAAKYAIGA